MRIKLLILALTIYRLSYSQNIIANFSYYENCANTPTYFEDNSSSNNGQIISWKWNFGDGANSTIQNPIHTYQTTGIYSVCLTVQNTNGDTDRNCKSIDMGPMPIANFTTSINGCVVTFTDISEGETSWEWNFYPGNPVYTDSSIIVTYPLGTYTACLIVMNQVGCSDTTCQTIIITSINENFTNNIFNIFPNPFSTQTIIQTTTTLKNSVLTIYNSIGQQVRQINFISGQTLTLQRDNLVSGIYFLQLVQDNKVLTTDKLVITDN